MLNRVALPALLLSLPLAAYGQPRVAMTGAQVRALTRQAQRAKHTDKNDVILDLDARVRARWGDFETFPISLVRRDDLAIVLASPYMTYRRAVADYLRMERPLAEIPWTDAITITVTPMRVDAPD